MCNLCRNIFHKGVLLLYLFLLTNCSSSTSPINEELEKLKSAGIFTISDDANSITLDGIIGSTSYNDFLKLEKIYKQAKTIKINKCNGSMDDEVNLKLGLHIYEKSFDIHINDNGLVASGGTDLFLSGRKRTIGSNTKIGVHAWSGENDVATDYPRGHQYHLPYIEYYKKVGFSQKVAEDFYYFTIYAAPANNIYWMTQEEITKYGILKN